MSRYIKNAFTLVEMLVVVAIIMVLAALLFPALGKAREGGRNARCSSNLHQLQLAVMNYSQGGDLPASSSYLRDNGDGTKTHIHGWVAWYDKFGVSDSDGNNGNNAWYDNTTAGKEGYKSITNGSLWAYVKTEDIFLCPTFAFRSVCGRSNARRSYAMNNSLSGANFLAIQGANKTVLFMDDNVLVGTAYNAPDAQFSVTNDVGKWHNKGGNTVFVDGHVERM
jgi:prepilin-type processing-associated H-X9-DG protein/prepilin-type N-terminal cleavage/methylation domain-containing protein